MSFLTSLRPSARAALSRSSTSSITSANRQQARGLAKFSIIGRLATQPELVTTASGREIGRYAVGTSFGGGEKRTTSWWKVAAFLREDSAGREILLGLGKGTMIYVEGEASMRKFERDGKTETGLSLIHTKFEVLDKRTADGLGEQSSETGSEGDVIEEQ